VWRLENKLTYLWQQQTVELAKRQSYLENAFGRRRYFQSSNFATKALAFLPASTLADCMLRCMIAFYPERFGKELQNLGVERVGSIPSGWRMWNQVHDSLAFTGPNDERTIKMGDTMRAILTQPWRELDGYCLEIDMEASDSSWGELIPYDQFITKEENVLLAA
jgi:DNA polymerase I-like protein with 3'-5' exonuclease and polymerase domains